MSIFYRTEDESVWGTEFGHNLQTVIRSKNVTQSQLARQLGITEAMLSRYIHGTSMPGVDKVYALANILGCRITDILGDYSID